jgi:hypothetical protein
VVLRAATLLLDAAVRDYPVLPIAYETALREPARTVQEVGDWLGIPLHADPIETRLCLVAPDGSNHGLGAEDVGALDELYDTILHRRPIDARCLERLDFHRRRIVDLWR